MGVFLTPRRRMAARAAEELKKRLEGLPHTPPARNEKDFPSAADLLRKHRERPCVLPETAAPPPVSSEGRTVSYSIDLPPEMEKRFREEADLERKTFSSRLIRLVESRRIRPSAFYRAADIDRKLFSAIRRNPYYQPSRETAIRCCLALRLNAEETVELLASAGYALSDARRFDLIIRECIERGICAVGDVNTILDALGEKPFR